MAHFRNHLTESSLAVALRKRKSYDRLDIRLEVYDSVSYIDIERRNSEFFYKAISIMEVVSNT
jgi:hypothetical protein